jgi:hypothetical protein
VVAIGERGEHAESLPKKRAAPPIFKELGDKIAIVIVARPFPFSL